MVGHQRIHNVGGHQQIHKVGVLSYRWNPISCDADISAEAADESGISADAQVF